MKKKINLRDRVVFSLLGPSLSITCASFVFGLAWIQAPALLAAAVPNDFDRIEGFSGDHPQPGCGGLRFLSPDLLEVVHVNTKAADANPTTWNFAVDGNFTAPEASSYSVVLDGQPVTAQIVGFKRRVLLARTGVRDVRIDNRILLKLPAAANPGATLALETTGWEPGGSSSYSATLDPVRRSPAIHTNHAGYITNLPKQAKIGYYLGTAGELEIPATTFRLVDAVTSLPVFEGTLTPSVDSGFTESPPPYTRVLQADFSAFNTPGRYQLEIPGLGRSLIFSIGSENSLYFARTYATGLLNQRCGAAFGLPHSRHGHPACHTAAAEIPTSAPEFKSTWDTIAAANADWSGSAPRIVSAETQLYPILRQGSIDTSGGHHDAGDYSKYTINSAQLIHALAFAADAFPNAGALDNLGIPESADGKSDLLQIALHEANYLAKLQDDDGGFFFIVYPKNRKYENDVLPQHGDPQVVWPKNTAATAAAVGALADIASSPRFRAQFPAESEAFLAKARKGWNFLIQAIQTHGKAGAYQKLTHYGDLFAHDDELAWAAAAMFAATGESEFHQKAIEWYDPLDPNTIRWGWWRLYEGYGCAARSYAFAVRTGKRTAAEMDANQLAKSETIILARGNDVRNWTKDSAYGVCFDWNTKQFSTAGWFFPLERAFDIVVADQIQPSPANAAAVLANINYEFGTNPLNLTYLTGTGLRSQQEIVHQFADNDDRLLPPSGIPIGSVQAGFSWNGQYQSELSKVSIPTDWAQNARYPFYDRWADTFNVTTEFVVAQQAKGLAATAAIAAGQAGSLSQPWNPVANPPVITLTGLADGYATVGQPFTASLSCPGGPDLSHAVVLWETSENRPARTTNTITITPTQSARQWIEAEALTPDGKRICARAEYGVKAVTTAAPLPLDDTTVALYSFDQNWNDASPNQLHLTATGSPEVTALASGWASNAASNRAVRFYGNNDRLTVSIPDRLISPLSTPTPLTFEFRVCPFRFTNAGRSNSPLAALTFSWANCFGLNQNMWSNPCRPEMVADDLRMLSNADWDRYVQLKSWNHIRISRDATGTYQLAINGTVVSTGTKTADFGGDGNWRLEIGNFDGYIDDLRISGLANHGNQTPAPPSTGSTGTTGSSGATTPPPPATEPPASLVAPFSTSLVPDPYTTALYHFDGDVNDSSSNQLHLTPSGSPVFVPVTNASGTPKGYAIRFRNFGDALRATIPDSLISPGNAASPLTIEAWILPRAYKAWGNDVASIFFLHQNWDSSLGLQQDKWLSPGYPSIRSGATQITAQADWPSFMTPQVWQHLQIVRHANGSTSIRVNGATVKSIPTSNDWGRSNDWLFTLGNVDADFDEVLISRSERPPLIPDEFSPDAATLALYHFNQSTEDSGPNALHLTLSGNTSFEASSTATSWMNVPSGSAACFKALGDTLTVNIPNALISPGTDSNPFTLEARIFPVKWLAYSHDVYSILRLYQHWDSSLGLVQDKWLLPDAPRIMTGSHTALSNSNAATLLVKNQWNHLKLCRTSRGTTTLSINGTPLPEVLTPTHNARTSDWSLIIGNFQGYVDELHITLDER